MANEFFLAEHPPFPPPPVFFRVFSKRVFRFPNLYKGRARKKIIFYQMQTGRKHQFSERIFQWKVAIFRQGHLYSFTNYIKMSCLGSCSTFPPCTVQMESHRILNFALVLKLLWGGLRTLVSKRQCCRLETSRFVLFHTKLIGGFVQMSVWNAFSPFTLCRLSSCLDADVYQTQDTVWFADMLCVHENLGGVWKA